MICMNCQGELMVADMDGADIIYSHIDDNGCDDPTPYEVKLAFPFEGGNVDEAIEDTYFRLIIESSFFDHLNSEDREIFLLTIAQSCIQWTLDRKDY